MCYYELPFTGTQHNFAYMEWYLSNISFFLLEARQWMYSGKTCRLSAYICLSTESLKAVVREIVPGNLVDQEDPTGPKVM